jgi:hypothetical protein
MELIDENVDLKKKVATLQGLYQKSLETIKQLQEKIASEQSDKLMKEEDNKKQQSAKWQQKHNKKLNELSKQIERIFDIIVIGL